MHRPVSRAAGFLLLAFLAACASSGKRHGFGEPNPHYKVGQPYQVQGEWYVPKPDPDYDKVGLASWYGPGFHGRLTANGEVFDENRLTAAHPTLPLPSIVEVTNPRNGKRLKLRVNDRGPFANDRILDLSKEAARRLGTLEAGVAPVRVRYIGEARVADAITRVGLRERGQSLYVEARPPAPAGAPDPNLPGDADVILADLDAGILDDWKPPARAKGSYFVQVGAFAATTNAAAAAAKLPRDKPIMLARAERDGLPLTLVRLGPFDHPVTAQQALEDARRVGFADALIIEEVLN